MGEGQQCPAAVYKCYTLNFITQREEGRQIKGANGQHWAQHCSEKDARVQHPWTLPSQPLP